MRIVLLLVLIFLMIGMFCFQSCSKSGGDDHQNDNFDDTATDDSYGNQDNDDTSENSVDDGSNGFIWTDPISGLVWEKDPGYVGTYPDNYSCNHAGDWRMPTIDELSTLIRGCQKISGCERFEGPADGCYWPSEMRGDCNVYISSTTIPIPRYGYTICEVDFQNGDTTVSVIYGLASNYLRCVCSSGEHCLQDM